MMQKKPKNTVRTSVDSEEIERFSKHAQDWWNPQGAMRPLHELNPVRVAYIRDTIFDHYKLPKIASKPLKQMSVLDVGCGAGLLCEPLARLGAEVHGLDASEEAIKAARAHAALSKLPIKYFRSSVEEFVQSKKQYDIITALEILEHVSDRAAFIADIAKLVKPGGLLIFSTINRTIKSYLLGVLTAEYLLRWVPKGTHSWRKFLRPSEVASELLHNNLSLLDVTGMVFDPLTRSFALSPHRTAVNYMMAAHKQISA